MGEWISAEQEPSADGKYLCVLSFGEGLGGGSYVDTRCFAKNLSKVSEYQFDGSKSSGLYGYDSEYGYYITDNVTHWMPLPSLP